MSAPTSPESSTENLSDLVAQAWILLDAGQTAEGRRLLERVLLADSQHAGARQMLLEWKLAPAWKLEEWRQQDQYMYFVDDNIREYHGPAAAKRLGGKRMMRGSSPRAAILQVDQTRWQEGAALREKNVDGTESCRV